MPTNSAARVAFLLAALVATGAGTAVGPGRLHAQDSPKPAVNFLRDIRPILSNNCFACHGPDENQRKAKLRLDTREGAFAELESTSRPVVPGNLDESELYQRVISENPDEVMPPPSSGKKLTARQKELLRTWIESGAEWKEHWAFVAPQKPAVPPAVEGWPTRNEIDAFVQHRLAQEGLAPSPEADRVTLIRRLTLDLTGLPPTPDEIDRFLSDETPQAYENVVDRLLNSPRYGEHMARYWLDAARYGDTHGLHLDNERSMWPYRNWVIDAYNRNLPFDQFIVEQIAGDLLPGATLEQRVATGFNRCNVSTGEGGSIDEEVRVRYVVDRVETLSTVFLGLTMGCSVCHDHKYDPLTQRDFYSLSAFYNSTADAAMDGNQLTPPPSIKTPTAEQTARLEEFDRQISALRTKIGAAVSAVDYTDPTPEATELPEPKEYVWVDDALPPGASPKPSAEEFKFVEAPDHPVHSGQKSHVRTAAGLSQHFFEGANPPLRIGAGDKLFAYVFLDPANPPKEIMLQFNDGTWEHRAYWGEDVIPWGNAGSPSRLAMGPLPEMGKWVRLEVEAAKVGLNPGAAVHGWAFTQHDGTVHWDYAGLVTRTPQAGQTFESLAVWSAFAKSGQVAGLPGDVAEALKVDAKDRSPEQAAAIRRYFIEYVLGSQRERFAPMHAELAALEKQRVDFDNSIPMTLVMADIPQPRETFILVRGQYDKHGEKVDFGVPAVLPQLPPDAPKNRLTLAQWLVRPDHPLVARVTMNRIWQQFFGTGIVKTSEDFGIQGEFPSHPELLDWLATDFIANRWDMKRAVKQIVMSHTYRQSSRVTPERLARDPENRLMARGSRFRLDAEVIRDQSLFLSGLLVESVGGKSVKPYQPEGLWEAVGFVGSNTKDFRQDNGAALYRRGIYIFWKRTCPPPSMLTFDAPSRETCTVRRARTNTPLQALALMNDVQYVEASRKFAERIMTSGGTETGDRMRWAFRTATGRFPSDREADVLARLYSRQREEFSADPESAAKLLAVGESKRDESLPADEHAAWTMVANLLLNLDEVVTRE